MQFTKEAQALAKATIEAIKKIAERQKCPECKGKGYSKWIGHGSKAYGLKCKTCNGSGKVEWEWKPEVGERFIHKKKIFLVINTEQCGIFPFPYFIHYHDEEMCLGMKDRQTESRKVIPLLYWERILRILRGLGYGVFVETQLHNCRATISRDGAEIVRKIGEGSQSAMMQAVIELGKEHA